MIIKVKVITNAKRNEIVEQDGNYFKIKISAPPVKGKANKELIYFLSKYFKVPVNKIRIIKGEKSKNKIIKVEK